MSEPLLREGDRVTVGATHEVKIDGLSSWVKMEINAAVQEGESFTEARTRVGTLLAGGMVEEIERQATVIAEANQAQRQ